MKEEGIEQLEALSELGFSTLLKYVRCQCLQFLTVVLLHHVGQLLLGHRPMIPQQVDEHELFRGKWHLGLAELCCYELLEPEACMVKVYGDFFRK